MSKTQNTSDFNVTAFKAEMSALSTCYERTISNKKNGSPTQQQSTDNKRQSIHSLPMDTHWGNHGELWD